MMIKKTCNSCGVYAWHNSCASKDREPRCTFCGNPPGGNSGSPKREYQVGIMAKQVTRARIMGIKAQ